MSWYYPKRGKKAAPQGMKLYAAATPKKAGWGRRWTDVVSRFFVATQRERGLRYAKAGHVLSVHIEQGFAVAEVQGTRARPYKVEIGLPMFTRKQWVRVAEALLKKAFYTAKLLAGDMPREIEAIFQAAGAPLIPTSSKDFSSDCSCSHPEHPCKHVAAACFILGQEMDRDPFLLMEMRGFSRAQLLAEIQTRRSAGDKAAVKPLLASPPLERAPHTLLADRLNTFFQAPVSAPPSGLTGPDDAARLLKPGGRIHEMGSPPFWQSDNNFEDVLTRIYQAVRKYIQPNG